MWCLIAAAGVALVCIGFLLIEIHGQLLRIDKEVRDLARIGRDVEIYAPNSNRVGHRIAWRLSNIERSVKEIDQELFKLRKQGEVPAEGKRNG